MYIIIYRERVIDIQVNIYIQLHYIERVKARGRE